MFLRDEDGVDIVALGVTPFVNEAELKGISGMEFVTAIDVFDEFHELATILLEASEWELLKFSKHNSSCFLYIGYEILQRFYWISLQ